MKRGPRISDESAVFCAHRAASNLSLCRRTGQPMALNPYESPRTDSPQQHKSKRRRLWGIDVIASVYALAAIGLGWSMADGTLRSTAIMLALVLVSAAISGGLFLRFNPARVLLQILLVVTAVPTALMAFVGIVEAILGFAVIHRFEELDTTWTRLVLTIAFFCYLRRPAVRDAFRGNDRK